MTTRSGAIRSTNRFAQYPVRPIPLQENALQTRGFSLFAPKKFEPGFESRPAIAFTVTYEAGEARSSGSVGLPERQVIGRNQRVKLDTRALRHMRVYGQKRQRHPGTKSRVFHCMPFLNPVF